MLRDKVRLWKGRILAVIAVENQTEVDYHMVIRNMLSEGMAYDRQWKKRKARHKAQKDLKGSDEWISGMKKGEKLLPVITIVVYYGRDKAWDGARTLYELLEMGEDSAEILPFVSNYKLNLFDYHDYDTFEQFHTELQSVFEFLRYAGDRKSLQEKLYGNKERYQNLSGEAKTLLVQLTGIRRMPEIREEEWKKGEFDMCKAFEDMRKEGLEQGQAQELVKNIDAAVRNFHLNLPEACKGLDSSIEEYEAAKKLCSICKGNGSE